MKKWIIGVVLVVFFMGIKHGIEYEPEPSQTVVHGLSDFSYTQIEKGMIYEAEELTVVDIYAESTENGKVVEQYYLVVFRDANDRLVAASMPIQSDDDIYWKLNWYAGDTSQSIGDCMVVCYVKATTVSDSTTNQAKLKEYFSDAVSEYTETFGEPLFPLEWQLDYYCAIGEDPLAKK